MTRLKSLRMRPVGGRCRGREARRARRDEIAGRILQQRIGHVVLHHIGIFDIADRIRDLLHVAGDALIALAADAGRPVDRLAFARAGSSSVGLTWRDNG